MRHLMSPLDFSVEELDKLLELAVDIEAHPDKYAHACEGKKLATLFYEPSTRTRLSFEAAMLNLGGQVLGFASSDSSSAAKGESVSDTIRVISSQRRSASCRIPEIRYSGHQRRGRRTPASYPDSYGSADHPQTERTPGRSDHRTLRRPEIRQDRPFSDPGAGTLQQCEIYPDFSGRTACAKLYPRGCAGKGKY